ncbi:MBL fold metallo-hydrolase [Aeropyrum pernix]|uniref:MBL fold metallo-hydrolase n=1 Tax=Aeropyrum pernix TaxID=56636 RepID=UPI0013F17A70|nr:MBL fold metallo-hydrolase [Aeropyrum pernix]
MAGARLVPGPLGGRFPFSNCVLVEDAGFKVLVDTGCEPWERGLVDVDVVVFTHFHPDHIRGFHRLRAGRVAAPEGEEPYAGRLERLALRFAGERWREWISMARLVMDLEGVPEPGEYFRPGEDLCFRGVCIKTYPARGHLQTHTLLELPGGLVHLVDIDLTGFGPWYGNPEASPELFLLDIEAAAAMEARSYLSAHKDRVYSRSEGVEALARFAGRLVEQAEGVYKALEAAGRPLWPWELTGRGIIYRRYLEGMETIMSYFEGVMIEKLLGLLGLWGCARKTPGGYVARDCRLAVIKDRITGNILSLA